MLISALVTFLVVILILYLSNLLPIDGRAKQDLAGSWSSSLDVISLLKNTSPYSSSGVPLKAPGPPALGNILRTTPLEKSSQRLEPIVDVFPELGPWRSRSRC